jgi:hypothetical protein
MTHRHFRPTRRRWLEVTTALATAVAAPISVAGSKKYSKERVGYRDEPYLGRACGKCVLYAGNGECTIVEGAVNIHGWCVQWTPATIGEAALRVPA